jgi:hypothetical protein
VSPRTARRGANAAEFAVIAPFILLMTFGMMEYGWYFQQRTAVVEAASDAARVASMVAQTGNPAVTASAKAVASCSALQFRGTVLPQCARKRRVRNDRHNFVGQVIHIPEIHLEHVLEHFAHDDEVESAFLEIQREVIAVNEFYVVCVNLECF